MDALTFSQLETLAKNVRENLFNRTINEVKFDKDYCPLNWFCEQYSKGNYSELLEICNSGLESMRGKSIATRCAEIVDEI